MTGGDDKGGSTGLWARLWRRPKSRWMLGIPMGAVVFFVAGIIFWGGFNYSMALSNTEAFCISCHEMRDNVYQEYKKTIHYSNPAGVRATCPDCHVPKEWVHKVVRKIKASNELLHKVLGTVDTREKFVANRLKMAKSVWASMKATDSRECRNCHAMQFMNLDEQDRRAKKRHLQAMEEGSTDTCIDCHQGIAHQLPEGY